jgi:hypothetical protein
MRSANSGLAAIELALLAPIFLFMLMATVEFGHALYQYNTLTKTVRDGAQYLARYASDEGALTPSAAQETAARCLVVYGLPACPANDGLKLLPGMDPGPSGDVTLTYLPPGAVAKTHVEVTATYEYVPLVNALIPSFGSGVTLTVPASFTASIRMKAL